MGQGQSQQTVGGDPALKVTRTARRFLTELDKLSLKKQEINEETIPTLLGIDDCIGAGVYLRVAQFFASYPIGLSKRLEVSQNVPTVIAFFNRNILAPLDISDQDYIRLLFLSIAATSSKEEEAAPAEPLSSLDIEKYYIVYQDLLDLWALLVSVYDKSPAVKFQIEVTTKDKRVAERLLRGVKAPIISFDSFYGLMNLYPAILNSFSIIFDQLLYPDREEGPAPSLPDIPRDYLCELYFALGPNAHTMISLYDGRRDGFSMQALHSKVSDWRTPTLLFVTGHILKTSNPLLDMVAPKVPGVKARDVKRVAFAVYIHSNWRQVGNFGDAETKIIQLAPEFDVYRSVGASDHAFFSLKRGLSFGAPLPKDDEAGKPMKIGNLSLFLSNSFEFGTFRQLGPGGAFVGSSSTNEEFEDRFEIDRIGLWGIGDKEELEEQYRKMDLKTKFLQRQRHRNDPEDRALLEMAGIVGQYPQ